MRNLYIFLFILNLLLISCNKSKTPAVVESEAQEDSIRANADTIGIDSNEVAPPKAVDELFADFIFSYSTNKSFQYRRTDFPLKEYRNGRLFNRINRIDWKFDKIYYTHSLHIIILDSEKTLNNIIGVKTDTVKADRLLFKQKSCKQYVFAKEQGIWRLAYINIMRLSAHSDAGFLSFYQKFATDTAFQMRHLSESIDFTTYDADNHYKKLDGIIDNSQWEAFRPELPANDVFCLDYGLPLTSKNTRIVSVRGNSNGMSSMFKFRLIKGAWKLVKFEN
jgi:hypothetical protein